MGRRTIKRLSAYAVGLVLLALYVLFIWFILTNFLFSWTLLLSVFVPLVIIGFMIYQLFLLPHQVKYNPIVTITAAGVHRMREVQFEEEHEKLVDDLYQNTFFEDNRAQAAKISERILRTGAVMIPVLLYNCRSEGGEYRRVVLELLDKLHPGGKMAAIIEGLEKGDPHTQWQACNVCRDLHEEAAAAVPALIEVSLQPYHSIARHKATTALASIGRPAIEPMAERVLRGDLQQEQRDYLIDSMVDALWSNTIGQDRYYRKVVETLDHLASAPDEETKRMVMESREKLREILESNRKEIPVAAITPAHYLHQRALLIMKEKDQ